MNVTLDIVVAVLFVLVVVIIGVWLDASAALRRIDALEREVTELRRTSRARY